MRKHMEVIFFLTSMLFTQLTAAKSLDLSAVVLTNEKLMIVPDTSYGNFMSAEEAMSSNVWFTDDYHQPWVLSKPKVPGNRHILLVRVNEQPSPDGKARCNTETDEKGYVKVIENCSMPIDSFEFFHLTVKETPLVQWSCDDSWQPALYIGTAPEGNNGYEGGQLLAISSDSELPIPKVEKIEPKLPASVEKAFAVGYDAWSFDFGDGIERWLIYYSDFRAGPYYRMIEYPRNSYMREVRRANLIFEGC